MFRRDFMKWLAAVPVVGPMAIASTLPTKPKTHFGRVLLFNVRLESPLAAYDTWSDNFGCTNAHPIGKAKPGTVEIERSYPGSDIVRISYCSFPNKTKPRKDFSNLAAAIGETGLL